MTFAVTFLTVLCVIGISLGQMLFKKAAMMLPAQPGIFDWLLNAWLLGALLLYGITTLAWVWVLRVAICIWLTRSWALHSSLFPFLAQYFCMSQLLGRRLSAVR